MNTILIPTDFSSAADNAMNYGARLAKRLQADILLLHVYMIPISLNETPVVVITGDELRKSADEGLERCRQELQSIYEGVQIKTTSRLGDVDDELEELCRETNPFGVVMGSHKLTGVEKVIFGSTTLSAMRHLKYPVIAVPESYKNGDIKTIVMATDLLNETTVPAEKIRDIVSSLDASLHIVHVYNNEVEKKEFPASLTDKINVLNPVYKYIQDDDVAQGVQAYIQQQNADLVIILQHEHTFWEKLFSKQHTQDLLNQLQIPVLSIHD
ncbi:MAG: universal stress protein [Chitinophagaceae bacterium]